MNAILFELFVIKNMRFLNDFCLKNPVFLGTSIIFLTFSIAEDIMKEKRNGGYFYVERKKESDHL